MAFNHATGAMKLCDGYSPWLKGMKRQIFAGAGADKEATVFKDPSSALLWIRRTIQQGRTEWKRRCREDGTATRWQDSDWKWLHRETWSVIRVFVALNSEHQPNRKGAP